MGPRKAYIAVLAVVLAPLAACESSPSSSISRTVVFGRPSPVQFTRVSDGAEIVGVNARSDEEADLGRQAVLDIYAERARERGAWGFRIGEYWRIVSHDTVFEWQGEEWPEGMADYVFNGRSFYMLEVDYLAEAPAEIDEFTFQAAE